MTRPDTTRPAGALRTRGLAVAALLVLAAAVTIVLAVLARASWLDRVPVDFPPSAAVVVVGWAAAAVLAGTWMRRVAAATGGRAPGAWPRRALWAGIVASAGLGLAQLAFMDFGRPTYREDSYADVDTFVVVVAVVAVATAVVGLLVVVRARRAVP